MLGGEDQLAGAVRSVVVDCDDRPARADVGDGSLDRIEPDPRRDSTRVVTGWAYLQRGHGARMR
jgi:hypothetical protein